jgi:hypothetical protein
VRLRFVDHSTRVRVVRLRIALLHCRQTVILSRILLVLVVNGALTLTVICAEDLLLEVLESNQDHCHIVECSPEQSILYNVLHSKADLLMHIC